jgi:hypothetical protein
MGLVRVAAEDRGEAERRGVFEEPSKSDNTLVLLGAEPGMPDEETAQVPARQTHSLGGFINGSVGEQFESERHLTSRRTKEQRIGLSPQHGVDQASSAAAPDDVIQWEFAVSKLVGWSPEEGRHRLGSQPQAERR